MCLLGDSKSHEVDSADDSLQIFKTIIKMILVMKHPLDHMLYFLFKYYFYNEKNVTASKGKNICKRIFHMKAIGYLLIRDNQFIHFFLKIR